MPDGTTRFSKDGQAINHRTPTFTEYTMAPEDKCVLVPHDTDLAAASLISCGVITGVGAVVNRAKVPTGATMAVFGCGGVGLSAVQGGKLANAAQIIAVDTVDFKLEKAAEMGATHFVNAAKEDPVKRIIEITGGGADYALEVVGLPAIAKQAFNSTRPSRYYSFGRRVSDRCRDGGRRLGASARAFDSRKLAWGWPTAGRLLVVA